MKARMFHTGRKRLVSLLLAVVVLLTLVPVSVLASAFAALAASDADIYVHWESDRDAYGMGDTAAVKLRVDLSSEAQTRLESLTITFGLTADEAGALGGAETAVAESGSDGAAAAITFDDFSQQTLTRELTVKVPEGYPGTSFASMVAAAFHRRGEVVRPAERRDEERD